MSNKTSSQSGDPDHHDSHFAPPPTPSNTDYRHARWPTFPKVPGSKFLVPGSSQEQIQNPKLTPKRNELAQARKGSKTQNPTIVVVGVCSAGKSTLKRKLRQAGYNVRTCAQEHSHVQNLWQLSNPDVLVYLDASLRTIRQRRKVKWQQGTLDEERRRLAHAREHCQLYIVTDGLSPDDVASRVINYLGTQGNALARTSRPTAART